MTDNLPSEGLVRTILATVAPGRYGKLVERETAADRSKLISEALTQAEIRAAETGDTEDREAVKNLRLLYIANKAAENTSPDSDPKELDQDFREHFRSRAENIASEDMQGFMAKLLGSELSTPGTISKRALNVVADMDRRDAELLVNLRKFVWTLGSSIQTIMLDLHRNRSLYKDNGINVETLNTLQGMGLLESQTISNYEYTFEAESLSVATYHSKTVMWRTMVSAHIDIGHALLTDIGKQILGLVDAGEPLPEYFDMCVNKWKTNKDLQVTILSGGPIEG